MFYFKVVAFVLGLLWTVAAGMAQWAPQAYTSFILDKCFPEQKPNWRIPAAVLIVLWSVGTWVACVFYLTPLTLMTTGFLTLGVFKMALIIPFYDTVRKSVVVMFTTEKLAFNLIKISSAVVGIGFLSISFFI